MSELQDPKEKKTMLAWELRIHRKEILCLSNHCLEHVYALL